MKGEGKLRTYARDIISEVCTQFPLLFVNLSSGAYQISRELSHDSAEVGDFSFAYFFDGLWLLSSYVSSACSWKNLNIGQRKNLPCTS
jgi:hypothetical protein